MRLIRTVGWVFAATAFCSVAVACGQGSSGHSVREVREVYHFDTLPDMVIASEIVVEARVTSVQPGRTVGAAGEDIQFNTVQLDVIEILWPVSVVAEPSFPMEELAKDEGVSTPPFPGFIPSANGDHGYYFLQTKKGAGEAGFYRLVNSQGRLMVGEHGILSGYLFEGDGEPDPLLEGFVGYTPPEFEQEIQEAVEMIQAGDVPPPPRNPCCVPPGVDA